MHPHKDLYIFDQSKLYLLGSLDWLYILGKYTMLCHLLLYTVRYGHMGMDYRDQLVQLEVII